MSYGNPTKWIPSEVEVDRVARVVASDLNTAYAGTGELWIVEREFYYSEAGDPSRLVEINNHRDSAVQICIQRRRKPGRGKKFTVYVKYLGRSTNEGVKGLVTKREEEFVARDEAEILRKLLKQ